MVEGQTKLTFPTMAEQALAQFRNATETVSLVTIARKMGAEVAKHWHGTEYTFDDDTSLLVNGTGNRHKVEVFLP